LLQGDDETFDNNVFVIPPELTRMSILYFGNESESDSRQPLYFLRRAFRETRRQTVEVRAHGHGSPVSELEMQAATLVVVMDSLPESLARALHEEATKGKNLLVVLKNEAVAATLAQLMGGDRVSLEEAHPGNYAMLSEIDFRNALFAPFAD